MCNKIKHGIGPEIAKIILKKDNKIGRLALPDFKTCYKATVIKTLWYWHEDRHVDQQNELWNPKISTYLWPGVFDKIIQQREWSLQ